MGSTLPDLLTGIAMGASAVLMAAFTAAFFMTKSGIDRWQWSSLVQILTLFIPNLVGGPLGEEAGWREGPPVTVLCQSVNQLGRAFTLRQSQFPTKKRILLCVGGPRAPHSEHWPVCRRASRPDGSAGPSISPRQGLPGRLHWDGVERLDRWLSTYLGADDSDYSRAVGSRWLISAVARTFQPGAKADCCLILEGPQGIRKSTALRTIAGEYFTDELADLGSKDAAMQTRGVWIIELSELDSLSHAEVARIKAFMSRTTDRFRPPYGMRLVESPRQCVFAGTVNHGTYLRDETGGRRFWPIVQVFDSFLEAAQRFALDPTFAGLSVAWRIPWRARWLAYICLYGCFSKPLWLVVSRRWAA
jgi:hypothetical protein